MRLYWLQINAAIMALCGVGYYLFVLWSALSFMRSRRRRWLQPWPEFAPPVSILKPVAGSDPGTYQCFRSHFLLDYPDYEIIFAANGAGDTAVPIVRQLMAEFPQRRVQLALGAASAGMNPKVRKLADIVPLAKHEYLLVNDDDIQVPPEYLQRVVGPLAAKDVGMTTCIYRAIAARSFWSKVEALGISTDFAGGVLAARQLEGGLHFGLGTTLAFRRRALEAAGGFETILDYLADDYELGRRISAAGYKVELADVEAPTRVPDYSFRQFFQHQLRWSRGIRGCRPSGFAGLIFTFGLFFAILAVAARPGTGWPWFLLATALVLRFAVALAVGVSILKDRQVLRYAWLIPIRDVVAVALWAASYMGRSVIWRGKSFILEKGKLRPAHQSTETVGLSK